MRMLLNTFWQRTIINGTSFLEENVNVKYDRAVVLVHVFYLLVFFLSMQSFSIFYQVPEWNVLRDSEALFMPLWCMAWVELIAWDVAVRVILFGFFVIAGVGALFWRSSWIIRLLVFLVQFSYIAFINSFGKIDHFLHLMLVASFILIFIPSNNNTQSDRKQAFLRIFWGVQLFILLTYFVSGTFKIYGIMDQELAGSISALSPDSLAQTMAKTNYRSNNEYFLGDLVLANQHWLASLFLISGFFVEFLSVYVAFRPAFHRAWGFLLILLHAFILMTVGPDFTMQILVVGLFILLSPFSLTEQDRSPVRYMTRQIPGRTPPGGKRILFYDGECMMCNGFINYLSMRELPDDLWFAPQSGSTFQQYLQNYPALKEADSFVLAKVDPNGKEHVEIKSKSIIATLSAVRPTYKVLLALYSVSPFIADFIYDVVAKNRKVDDVASCPMPPDAIRRRVLS